MKADQKCYILAPFTLMVTDFSLPQLPALCGSVDHLQYCPTLILFQQSNEVIRSIIQECDKNAIVSKSTVMQWDDYL
jgi:hypothetical protein